MLGHRPLNTADYLAILKRRWWILLLPVLLLPAAGYFASYLVSPQYVSQTLVLIEQQRVPDEYVKPVIAEDLDARLASMKEQILSRSRIQPIMERYNLFPGRSIDDRIEAVQKSIGIKPIRSEVAREAGSLPGFFITFKASDPHVAQQVCGEITSLFVNENLRAREQSAQGTTSFLQGQLAEAKNNLDAQDAKLAEFQRKYIGRLPGEEAPNLNMLTSLNTQLEAATQALGRMEQDRAYQQSILSQMTHENTPTSQPASPRTALPDERQTQLALLEGQASDMSLRYTADYPDLVILRRKISDLKREIARNPVTGVTASGTPAARPAETLEVQQLRAQLRASEQGVAAKRAEQANLQTQVRSYQDRISSSPLVEEEYKALTRDYQTAQKFYDDLLAKMNQSKMATDLERRQQGEHFTVMDQPNLPEAPDFPKRPLFAAGGLALGLLLGLSVIGYLEYRDVALRTEADVTAFLNLPTLATINYVTAAGLTRAEEPAVTGERGKGIGRFRRRQGWLVERRG